MGVWINKELGLLEDYPTHQIWPISYLQVLVLPTSTPKQIWTNCVLAKAKVTCRFLSCNKRRMECVDTWKETSWALMRSEMAATIKNISC